MEDFNKIQEGLNFPFVKVERGCLGGEEIFVLVSLEDRSNWFNGYVENSPYARFCLVGGKIEQFSGCGIKKNFRKCNYKDIDEAIKKLNKFYEDVC